MYQMSQGLSVVVENVACALRLSQRARVGLRVVTVMTVVTLLSCKKTDNESTEPASSAEPVASAGKPVLDSKVASAVEAAAKEGGNQVPAGQTGLIDAAAADKEVVKGAPSVFTFGNAGKDPKIKFGPGQLPAALKLEGGLEVAVHIGQRAALPTIAFDFDVSSKAEAEGKVSTTLRVSKASLGNDQPGRLPEGLEAQIAKFKGSTFSFVALPDGTRAPIQYTAAKGAGAKEDFEALFTSAQELLEGVILPLPQEPVGEGAYWMVKARESFHGSDVVAYRLVKVEELKGSEARLSIATKRSLVGDKLSAQGLPPHKLLQFDGSGEGQVIFTAGASLPAQGQSRNTLGAAILPEGKDRAAQLQPAVQEAKFGFGAKR